MMRISCVLVVGTLILMLAAPAATAFPEVGDEVYSWHKEDAAGDVEQRCGLAGDPAPCDILGYSVGNTDTHLLIRWELATSDFATTGTLASVLLIQSFKGTNANAENMKVCAKISSAGTEFFQHATDCSSREGWAEAVEFRSTTGTPATIEFAIPFTLIEPFMNETFAAGVSNVDFVDVKTRVNNADAAEQQESFYQQMFAQGDSIPAGELGKYVFKPWGSLQAPPSEPDEILENVTGLPLSISKDFTEATSGVFVYNWSMDADAFVLNQTVAAAAGNLSISVSTPAGEAVLDDALTNGTAEELFAGVTPGNWTIRLTLEEFIGSFEIRLDAPPAPGGDGGENGNGDGGDGAVDGNETDDPADIDDNGIPAPGVALLIVATLAALAVLRRRR